MIKKTDIESAIIEEIQVDDEGLKDVKVIDIKNLMSLGIADVASFVSGVLDAENDKELNDSEKDYVKGYKYGKTGSF